jgi:hypothetical protein
MRKVPSIEEGIDLSDFVFPLSQDPQTTIRYPLVRLCIRRRYQFCRSAGCFNMEEPRARLSLRHPSTTHSQVFSLADHTLHLHHKAANDPVVVVAHKQ